MVKKVSSGFSLTKPALLATIAYLVMAVVILLPFNIGDCDYTYGETKTCYNFWRRLLILLIMFIPFALSVYSINCMMVGKCVVWSWINSVFVAIWVLLFLIASVMSYNTSNSVTNTSEEIIIISA